MTEAVAACANCGAQLQGPYCQACGQKAASAHLGLHEVLHEVTHEFLHLDGKIFRTVKLLITKPGQLTLDLVAGRRMRYVGPLRLYLTASLLFFLLLTVLPGGRNSVLNVNVSTQPGRGWTARMGPVQEKRQEPLSPEGERLREEIGERIIHNLPRVVFALVPMSALLTFAFYRRRQPYYVSHLYYSVHMHSFVFLAGAANVLLSRAGTLGDLLALANGAWFGAYHFLALKRFFGESWARTLWKGTTIAVLYLVLMIAAAAGLVMFAISLR
jgi:Protein of unknown function (DUF3667)